MKIERNRAGNKYTFTPEEKKDEEFLDKVYKKIDDLEEENKKLKEILNRIKELYEDEEEAELLNYLDEILDEI